VPTHAELVTPERILYSGAAEFVVLRTDGGEIMFLPHHADFVGAVDICVVRIAPVGGEGGEDETHEVRAAMAGGFVHVADNRVTVLASIAELAGEIDVERARRALQEAEAAEGEGAAPVPGAAAAPELTPEAEGHEAEEVVSSSTMLALLRPDVPEVRARRARARLEAAGVLEASGASTAAPTH
jgi:F-type H+-transporting ATPase subunit epsilon